MIIVPFKAWHLDFLSLQKAQKILALEDDYGQKLEGTIAYSAFREDGTCIAAMGVVDMGLGRGQGWALISEYARPYFTALTRRTLQRLPTLGFKRVEIVIHENFPQSHRWARILGFECETPNGMKNYINGMNCHLYSRVF